MTIPSLYSSNKNSIKSQPPLNQYQMLFLDSARVLHNISLSPFVVCFMERGRVMSNQQEQPPQWTWQSLSYEQPPYSQPSFYPQQKQNDSGQFGPPPPYTKTARGVLSTPGVWYDGSPMFISRPRRPRGRVLLRCAATRPVLLAYRSWTAGCRLLP